MKIENIIYETTRSIYSIEDKLRIASIFIFCYQLNAKSFAELLYSNDHEAFISKMMAEHKAFGVDFNIRLNDRNVRDAFMNTLERVKKSYDADGYYKALFQKDPFALVVDELVNYQFDAIQFNKSSRKLEKQLQLPFN